MYKKIFGIFVFFIFALTPYYMLPATAFAQASGLNLTVSPSVLDITANPGDIVKQKFRVRNNTANSMTVSISIDKLTMNQNGDIQPVRVDPHDTSMSWVTVDQNPISLNSLEWTTITVTASIPKDAAFGYYYGIRLSQQTNQTQNESGAKLLGEVVIPFLLTVKSPNAKAMLQLVSFSAATTINEYLPVNFSVVLKNAGNIHIRPKGNIFIRTGVSDSNVSILDINQAGGAILPNAKRSFVASWSDGFVVDEPVIEDGQPKIDGSGKVMHHLVFNWDRLTHFRIGKYTATALVVYDNGSRDIPLQMTTSFWVIPWKILLGSVIVLIAVIFLVRFWLKWYVARQIHKYKSS